MAEITKSGTPSLVSILPPQGDQTRGLAATDIAAGDACYIASSGLITLSTGAAATAPAQVVGFAAMAAKAGEPVTLVSDVVLAYGSGLTPGTKLFLSGTVPGGLADVASTGGTGIVARVLSDGKKIRVFESRY